MKHARSYSYQEALSAAKAHSEPKAKLPFRVPPIMPLMSSNALFTNAQADWALSGARDRTI